MSEIPAPPSRVRRGLLIWALTATVAAIVFANLALLFFVRWRTANQARSTPKQGSVELVYETPVAVPGASSFADLQDSDVAGHYKYYELTNLMGTIKLLPDHTIINKDGTKYPRYYCEIQADGILTRWQRADVLFNMREKPGVYIARRKDGVDYRRIEKIDGAVDR